MNQKSRLSVGARILIIIGILLVMIVIIDPIIDKSSNSSPIIGIIAGILGVISFVGAYLKHKSKRK